jgi:hypothetical protein
MITDPAKRFTRRRDARIYTRVDEMLLDRVANYGNAKRLSLSEAVRALVEIGLDHAT